MREKAYEIRHLLSWLFVLVLALPLGIAVFPSTPVFATVDNVTIVSPTGTAPGYGHAGGSVNVTFALGVSGATGYIDYIYHASQGGVDKFTYSSSIPSSDNGTINSYSYSFPIPAGTANGTYDLRVEARHPGGSGSYRTSGVNAGAIIIQSTHTPATPVLLSPATATCSSSRSQIFQWNGNVEPGYTFTYNLQVSTNPSFSGMVLDYTTSTGVTSYEYAFDANGLYYWRVRAYDQYGNASSWSEVRNICVDNTSFSSVTVTLVSPDNAYTVPGPYNPTLTWSSNAGSVDTTPCANIQYVVEIHSNEDCTALVNTATVSGTSYTPGTLLGSGTFYWKVRAKNCAGEESPFSSVSSFTIPAGVTTYNIPMQKGWNFISLPLIPSDKTGRTVLASILPYLVIVDYYGPTNCGAQPTWHYLTPTGGDMTKIEDGKSYFIYVNQDCTLTITGTQAPPPPHPMPAYNLCYYPGTATIAPEGWNMVGFKSTEPMKASDYFKGVDGKYSGIYYYAGSYVLVGADDNLTPGTGYWIYMTQNGQITPPAQ